MTTVAMMRAALNAGWATRLSLLFSTVSVGAAVALLIAYPTQMIFVLLNLVTLSLGVATWGIWLRQQSAATSALTLAYASDNDPTLPTDDLVGVGPTAISPFAEDPLFRLPAVGDATVYLLPKEGEPLHKSQDFYAVNAQEHIYAITDGVSTSFAPRAWASLIARGAVASSTIWRDQATFTVWLSALGATWRTWMEQRWVPGIHAQETQRGEVPSDYREQIHDKGAQTTLICAVLAPGDDPGQVQVHLLAIGDAEAFHVQQVDGDWAVRQAFPIQALERFGVQPTTLATIENPDWYAYAWDHRATETLTTQAGDRLVLTSDTLAEWLLHDADTRMRQLLALTSPQDFARLVAQERQSGQMKDDDMTVLIIPIRALAAEKG